MATMQPQVADSPPAEFVLAGRSWLFVSVAVLCLAAAIYFFVTRDHPFVGLHWQMWRALGISLEERQDL
ncbi:hypothetical protein [Paraburkholderia sp. D1E]|uniref:hypothetical protein n=1 Tax=Paraburkholderia sp. D1E TaxID=3461398 RepID=UPI0040459B59